MTASPERTWYDRDIAQGFRYGYTYLGADIYEEDRSPDEIFEEWLQNRDLETQAEILNRVLEEIAAVSDRIESVPVMNNGLLLGGDIVHAFLMDVEAER